MRRIFLIALVLACLCGAPSADAQTARAAAPPAERPLDRLPYTPGLDVSSMDRSANACVDFYQYSCGGWISHNPIPSDQASWSVYGKLYQDNQQLLWGILESLGSPTAIRSANQQKIGDYFAACMDEGTISRLEAEPLAPTLASIEALGSVKELPTLLARLQLATAGSGFLFTFGSNQDYSDSNRVIAFAMAGGLGMPDRDYYTDLDAKAVELRRQYSEHVARTFVLLGDTPR